MESGAKERTTPALANQRLAQVLEHPLRARITAELRKHRMSPAELAETLGEPLPQVAYHWRVLGAVQQPE